MGNSSVSWVQNDDKWELHFEPYYDDEIIAVIYQDEDGDWYYDSNLLKRNYNYLDDEGLEEAKAYMERIIKNHCQDEANYYTELLQKFEEREQT